MSRRKQQKPYKVDDIDLLPELRRSKRLMKCNKCGKVLASALSLARHKLTHSQAKTYPCPKCEASFKTSSNMHRHLRIHSRGQEQMDKTLNGIEGTPKPPAIRISRQHIKTPTKYKEFDMDLVGRSSHEEPVEMRVKMGVDNKGKKRSRSSLNDDLAEQEEKIKANSHVNALDISSDSSKLDAEKIDQDLFCHICNKSFISKFGLMTHSLLHPDSSTKCNVCDQIFTTREALAMHNIIAHKILKNSNDFTASPVNKNGFQDLALIDFSVGKFPTIAETVCSLVAHGHPKKDTKHSFVCKKCNRAFPLLESLEMHYFKTHTRPKIQREVSDQSAFLGLFNLHVKGEENKVLKRKIIKNGISNELVHTSETVVTSNTPLWMLMEPELDSANYRSAMFGEVNQFVSERLPPFNNERNVFWCRICNYSSHEKSAIVRHLLTHSGIRPYFCKICKYAFTTKANCERHVRKRHKCTDRAELNKVVGCDDEMLKKAPKDDIYMISGSNNSCPVCSKSFPCSNDLKEHLKIHEERQFVCQLCNIRCTTRNNCVRHILHKHPGIPHTEANEKIVFMGKNRNLHREKSSSSSLKELSQINISRGSLLKRDRPKTSSSLLRWKPTKSSLHFSHSTQTRTTVKTISGVSTDHFVRGNSRIASTLDDDDAGVEEKENSGGEMNPPPKKVPKLIPLLKIKAYNEAAMKSYSDMVEMYKGLNEQTFIMHKKSAMQKITESNGLERQKSLEMDRSKTAFICWACSAVFETENALNSHLSECSKKDNVEVYSQDIFGGADDENSQNSGNQDNNEEGDLYPHEYQNMNYNFGDNPMDWSMNSLEGENLLDDNASLNTGNDQNDISNIDEIINLSQNSSNRVFNKSFQNVGEWVDKIVPKSPESTHSSETPVNSELASPFLSDIPRVFAKSSKDTTFEDTLLMSMYKENKRKDKSESPAKSLSSFTNYSSSLPTMVNMDTMSLTRRNYQDDSANSEVDMPGEEKVLVPSKGRFYTARKCPQCDKSFPWASSLRRHIMTHTGLKLYMCRLCKMRFTTRSNLIRHVYRRHGMAKQHPDFASCLAKLHPSDTLLREVEADVRRRVETQTKSSPVAEKIVPEIPKDQEYDSNGTAQSDKFKVGENDFQSMLEEDPETLLVDLDYSPREDLVPVPKKNALIKTEIENSGDQIEQVPMNDEELSHDEGTSQDQPLDMSINDTSDNAKSEGDKEESNMEVVPYAGKSERLRARKMAEELKKNATEPRPEPVVEKKQLVLKGESKQSKLRNKQSTQFVCGLCKKIFKTVPELVEHLDTHDVPHSWHCSVCGVPFTNKYNCQRHLIRRHGRSDLEPVYVEDMKHGPRTARGLPRKNPLLEDGNISINSV